MFAGLNPLISRYDGQIILFLKFISEGFHNHRLETQIRMIFAANLYLCLKHLNFKS